MVIFIEKRNAFKKDVAMQALQNETKGVMCHGSHTLTVSHLNTCSRAFPRKNEGKTRHIVKYVCRKEIRWVPVTM